MPNKAVKKTFRTAMLSITVKLVVSEFNDYILLLFLARCSVDLPEFFNASLK